MTSRVAGLVVGHDDGDGGEDEVEEVLLPLGGAQLGELFGGDDVDEAALGDFDLRLLLVADFLADLVGDDLGAVGGALGVGVGGLGEREDGVAEGLGGDDVGDGDVVAGGKLLYFLGLFLGEGGLVGEDDVEGGGGADVLEGDGDGDGLAGGGVGGGDVLVEVEERELLLGGGSGGVGVFGGGSGVLDGFFFLGDSEDGREEDGSKKEGDKEEKSQRTSHF